MATQHPAAEIEEKHAEEAETKYSQDAEEAETNYSQDADGCRQDAEK